MDGVSELISGKEAFNKRIDGVPVQWAFDDEQDWKEWGLSKEFSVDQLTSSKYKFRLKPRTIKINGVEVPRSTNGNEYNGGLIWILCGTDTREYTSLALDESDEFPAYWWKSEEEIKQVVAALRSVFNDIQ